MTFSSLVSHQSSHYCIFKNAKRSPSLVESSLPETKEAGLKLKPSKCDLFKKSLMYLGHRISVRGTETGESKSKEICKWPTPKTVTEVKSF